MKNTVRVHRKSATERTSSQVQIANGNTPPKAVAETAQQKERRERLEHEAKLTREFAMPREVHCYPTCLAFIDRVTMKPLGKIPLSEDEFRAVLLTSGKEKIEPGEFVASAIREKLANKSYQLMGFADSMDHAVKKATVLMELIDEYIQKGDCIGDEQERDRFNFGMFLLMRDVSDGLKKSCSAIMAAAYGKSAEVAS